jgi:hypothetical protein
MYLVSVGLWMSKIERLRRLEHRLWSRSPPSSSTLRHTASVLILSRRSRNRKGQTPRLCGQIWMIRRFTSANGNKQTFAHGVATASR